jgi:multidrug efflux pump subunit AcrA (membrane-fusion protein)
MPMLDLLAQWTIRSAILILIGALILSAFRVKDPSTRLAAWIAVLVASMAIPAMTTVLPAIPLTVMETRVPDAAAPTSVDQTAPVTTLATPEPQPQKISHFDWQRAVLIFYTLVTLAMLLRLGIGIAMTIRLRRRSCPTQEIGIHQSTDVSAPVTLGILNPVIVLPVDWRDWEPAKLEAVLEHERSHIRRYDPVVQLLSAIHRALLWHSPLSWFLHSRIIRIAEEASDDAAVAATRDRAVYAEWLLEFMQRGVCNAGVPMARYGSVDKRIHRILSATVLSRGITRIAAIAVLAIAAPMAYLTATAQLRSAPTAQPTPIAVAAQTASAPVIATPQKAMSQPRPDRPSSVIVGLGNVTAMTVTIRPRIDGQLISLDFKEGESVEAGKLIATIESPGLRAQLDEAERILERDARSVPQADRLIRPKIVADQESVDGARRALDQANIRAPISGIAGLRLVDPGNMVRTTDSIVTIAQIQPIAVVFTIPGDALPRVRARLIVDAHPVVEAWSRDNKTRLASGVLAATDNQIDPETGTVKLKASFENKDGALFPNQFVNVRLLLSPH